MYRTLQEHNIMLRTEKIEGVIWDWDGVMHPYIPFAKSLTHWNGAAVRAFNTVAAANNICHDLDHDTCLALARTSFHERGLSTAVFTEKFNLNPHDVHIEFHRETRMEDVVGRHEGLADELERLSHLKHVILSQGSEEWIHRAIEFGGYSKLFQDVTIISFEKCGLRKKSASEVPFALAIEASGLPADRLVIPEDMKKNLVIAKQMGLQTAFIAQSGLEPEWVARPTADDAFVDQAFEHTVDFVRALAHIPAHTGPK